MKRFAARFAPAVGLLLLGCAMFFGFPTRVGVLGLVIGGAALFIPDSWGR